MKKLLTLATIFLLSASLIHADEGHDDEIVFGIEPSNFIIEKAQPGQEEITESLVDNDLDTDIIFNLKLTRLDGDTEISVPLTGDVMELEFEGLIDGQFIAKANSETPMNFTMSIDEEAPDGTFIYYLDLIDVTEGGPYLDGDIFMTFEVEIEDSTILETEGSFNLDINPWIIAGGCLTPFVLIGIIVFVIVKKKKD